MKRIILAICLLSFTAQAQPTDSTTKKPQVVEGVLVPTEVYNEMRNYLGKFPFNDIVVIQVELQKYQAGKWINVDAVKADTAAAKPVKKK